MEKRYPKAHGAKRISKRWDRKAKVGNASVYTAQGAGVGRAAKIGDVDVFGILKTARKIKEIMTRKSPYPNNDRTFPKKPIEIEVS